MTETEIISTLRRDGEEDGGGNLILDDDDGETDVIIKDEKCTV